MLLCLRGRDGEFKFAVAAVGPRSPLGRGAAMLLCSAKASCGARGDRVLRRHPHRACKRIDAIACCGRGQNAAAHRLRSRLREECHGCTRSVMRVRANDLDVTAALVRTVCCVGRVLKLISRSAELASTTEIFISRQRSFSAFVFPSCDTCKGKIDGELARYRETLAHPRTARAIAATPLGKDCVIRF